VGRNDETYRLDDVELIQVTEKAWLVREADIDDVDIESGVNEWWMPLSQIESTDIKNVGDIGYVYIPEWLAAKAGLLDDEDDYD
jgi:hypothetical protein